MAIVRIKSDSIAPLRETSFVAEGLRERGDLQRLLRRNISVIDPDLLVVAEEFGGWDESRRRIDLLAIDRSANLVVIELKRDDDAHMDLQALRYAAMVSAMTFDQVAATFADFLREEETDGDARQSLLAFLSADEEPEPAIGDVRIVLVAADFSKELTTTVLWLNGRGLDIKCVRLKPYREGDMLLADVQQIIPLREAEEYLVSVREKRREAGRATARATSVSAIVERLSESDRPLAEELIGWIEPYATRINVGVKGVTPLVEIGGKERRFIRLRDTGEVVICFDSLALTPPFESDESRQDLRTRLSSITGVQLSPTPKPRFPLSLLGAPERMKRFQETIEWAIERAREATMASHP